MAEIVKGFIIRNECGADLAETGFWYQRDRSDPTETEPFVHDSAVLDAIQRGGAVDWKIKPHLAIPAEYDAERPDGSRVNIIGSSQLIKPVPGSKDSYALAVQQLAVLLRGGQSSSAEATKEAT